MTRWRKTYSAPASKPSQQTQSVLTEEWGVVRRWNYETPPHQHGYIIEIIKDPERDPGVNYKMVADGPRYAFHGIASYHFDTLQSAYDGAQELKNRLSSKYDL